MTKLHTNVLWWICFLACLVDIFTIHTIHALRPFDRVAFITIFCLVLKVIWMAWKRKG